MAKPILIFIVKPIGRIATASCKNSHTNHDLVHALLQYYRHFDLVDDFGLINPGFCYRNRSCYNPDDSRRRVQCVIYYPRCTKIAPRKRNSSPCLNFDKSERNHVCGKERQGETYAPSKRRFLLACLAFGVCRKFQIQDICGCGCKICLFYRKIDQVFKTYNLHRFCLDNSKDNCL